MISRWQRGLAIFGQSWRVLMTNKSLLLLPIMSFCTTIVLIGLYGLMVWKMPVFQHMLNTVEMAEKHHHEPSAAANVLVYALLFGGYLLAGFVVNYFNTALVACATLHFKGQPASLGQGFALANRRVPQIFAWTLLATTVGFILRLLEERAGILGAIVIRFIGAAWSVASCLVIPILAIQGIGPIAAVKASTELIHERWGEKLVGAAGIGVVTTLLILLGVVGTFAGVVMVDGSKGFATEGIVILGILYAVVVIAISSALQQIFIAGLHLYATEGGAPAGFSADLLDGAFQPKKK